MKNAVGRLHSIESFGAVDGPGVRFVAFLQGCPLRCRYCHNPDTWNPQEGTIISSGELVEQILTYKSFISRGGVTISGGEPLLQPEFCEAVIDGCHQNGIHTAIDTSGFIPLEISKNAIDKADMLLLDIKDIDSKDCEVLTGKSNENAVKTLDYCEKTNKPVWIRHVIVPHYTLNDEKLHRLGKFLKNYSCIQKVELLPYHTMGKYKWEQLKIPYSLEEIEPPAKEEIERAKEILRQEGIKIE